MSVEDAEETLDRTDRMVLESRVLELEGQVFSLNQQAQAHRAQATRLFEERDDYRERLRKQREWADALVDRLNFFSPGDQLGHQYRDWRVR